MFGIGLGVYDSDHVVVSFRDLYNGIIIDVYKLIDGQIFMPSSYDEKQSMLKEIKGEARSMNVVDVDLSGPYTSKNGYMYKGHDGELYIESSGIVLNKNDVIDSLEFKSHHGDIVITI